MLRKMLKPAQPIGVDGVVVRLKGCPDCFGRGYFLIEPFKQGGGAGNMTQCPTCLSASEHFDKNGYIPADIASAQHQNMKSIKCSAARSDERCNSITLN